MTERDEYTPSVDEARRAWSSYRHDPEWFKGQPFAGVNTDPEFDRMIEAVRQEERERIAAEIERGYLGPDFARRPDGSEGPEARAAHAYDEGLEHAARIARGGNT